MTQPLLHRDQNRARGVTPGLDMQNPVRVETDMRQGGREEIALFGHPQHRARQARQNARYHQHSGGAMFQAWAGIRDVMQPTQTKAAAGQMAVDGVDFEGQNRDRGFGVTLPFQAADVTPQPLKSESFKVLIMLTHLLRSI
jgi:hypothetical protein